MATVSVTNTGTNVQVKLHYEKIEAEREEQALGKLQASVPRLSKRVLALALHDCRMDVDRALMLLRQFQADHFEDLESIMHKRKLSVHDKPNKHDAVELASLERDEVSDPRDEDGRRHKHSKSKKESRKESKNESKRSKHKDSKKDSRKDSKKDKKRRREDDSDEDGARASFGAWGIIRESDYTAKRAEFLAWATEVKHIDVEGLPRCALHVGEDAFLGLLLVYLNFKSW